MVRRQVLESCGDLKAQLTREFEDRLRKVDTIEVSVQPARKSLKIQDKLESTLRSQRTVTERVAARVRSRNNSASKQLTETPEEKGRRSGNKGSPSRFSGYP